MVALLAKASIFHSVNLALSANGGSNPARDVCSVPAVPTQGAIPKEGGYKKKSKNTFVNEKQLLCPANSKPDPHLCNGTDVNRTSSVHNSVLCYFLEKAQFFDQEFSHYPLLFK